ncbi:PTS sugar transporter subunit IIB, partial [Latilactobacillus curvatus]
NVGGTKQREGTKNYSKAVNLTDLEVDQLKALSKSGVDVFIQQVPNEKKMILPE